MNRQEIFNHICDNYDNLDILSFVKDLLFVVINDVEYMNDLEEQTYYDLGNNNCIENEDFESLVSIAETIFSVEQYNKEGVDNVCM